MNAIQPLNICADIKFHGNLPGLQAVRRPHLLQLREVRVLPHKGAARGVPAQIFQGVGKAQQENTRTKVACEMTKSFYLIDVPNQPYYNGYVVVLNKFPFIAKAQNGVIEI